MKYHWRSAAGEPIPSAILDQTRAASSVASPGSHEFTPPCYRVRDSIRVLPPKKIGHLRKNRIKGTMNKQTSQPVAPGEFSVDRKEFGRQADVERIYGLKRGTTYNLCRQKKIRGVLLRVKGQKSGVRLWDMESIREFITSQMPDRDQPQT
jgi:hypothetical protein